MTTHNRAHAALRANEFPDARDRYDGADVADLAATTDGVVLVRRLLAAFLAVLLAGIMVVALVRESKIAQDTGALQELQVWVEAGVEAVVVLGFALAGYIATKSMD